MGIEIERKFLVKEDLWRRQAKVVQHQRQGYLNSSPERRVRVRVAGDKGYLTVKGPPAGAVRCEFEYTIPFEDAHALLTLCERPLVEKNRHRIATAEVTWEVDEFLGENQGLIVAEVELRSEDQVFEKPAWLGKEVTHDPRYYSGSLVRHPYCDWGPE